MNPAPILYLAPLHGITDTLFCRAFMRHFGGIDLAIAPFIATNQKGPKGIKKHLGPSSNRAIPTTPQLMSKNPDEFCSMAQALFDMGYDTLNWNLGCPYPMVVKKGRGSGMLPFPEQIDRFLEHAMPNLRQKLSIKLRLGLNSADEIDRVLPVFNRYNLHQIIIHPRTAKQMYKGLVDLDAFGRCLGLSKHAVVYNGDITTCAAYHALAARFPSITGWMIGRGLLCNPFLASEIKGDASLTDLEKIKVVFNYHHYLFMEYSKTHESPRHLIDKMINIWEYLADYFDNSHKVKKLIHKAQNIPHYTDEINRLFDGALAIKHDAAASSAVHT
jgi:tRNA-dihydrouridine synthase B